MTLNLNPRCQLSRGQAQGISHQKEYNTIRLQSRRFGNHTILVVPRGVHRLKNADTQPYGVSVRDICNIYHGDWVFKDRDEFGDCDKLAPAGDISPIFLSDTLVAFASNAQYARRQRSLCLSAKHAPKATNHCRSSLRLKHRSSLSAAQASSATA